MASNTWNTVAVPLLEHFATHEAEYAERLNAIGLSEILAATGLNATAVALELTRLFDGGYLEGEFTREHPAAQSWLVAPTLTERGARASGRWPPNDPGQAMLAVIERMLAAARTPAERSFLQKMKDSFAGVPGNIAGGLAVEVAKAVGGIS